MLPEIKKAIDTVIHPINKTKDTTRPSSTIQTNTITLPLAYDNLLSICSAALERYDYVLSDLGKATLLDETGLANNFLDSHLCTAPELLCVEPYGKPVDIFCYGAVLFTCATGLVVGSTREERMRLINGSWNVSDIIVEASSDVQENWRSVPLELREVIESCSAPDPKNRPTADTVAAKNDTFKHGCGWLVRRDRAIRDVEEAMKAYQLRESRGTTASDQSVTTTMHIDKAVLKKFYYIGKLAHVVSSKEEEISIVVHVMRTMIYDADIQTKGLRYMTRYSIDSDDRLLFINQGGLAIVITAMTTYSKDSDVQVTAIEVLYDLAVCNQKLIASPGSLKVILESMINHRSDTKIQIQGFRILCHLARTPNNPLLIAELGGLAIVITAMTNHSDDSEVQGSACRALMDLAVNPKNQALIADQRGVEMVINALKNHPNDWGVRVSGCRALAHLGMLPSNQELIANLGGLDLLMQIMQNNKTDDYVQVHGCCGLVNLANLPTNQILIVDKG